MSDDVIRVPWMATSLTILRGETIEAEDVSVIGGSEITVQGLEPGTYRLIFQRTDGSVAEQRLDVAEPPPKEKPIRYRQRLPYEHKRY